MRKKITPVFVDALKKAIDECGSQSELARRSGVGQATISAIINPKKKPKMVLDSILDQLAPFCDQYLPVELRRKTATPENIVNSSLSVNSICQYALEILQDQSLSPDKKIRLLTLYFKEKI